MMGNWRVSGLHHKINRFLLLLLCCLTADGFAQLGHEWIQFNQEYFKIPITQTGIYKLTYQDLSTAGLPVGTINPNFIQIFRRGKEQAVHFQHATQDGVFEPGEYLEFYGERNDGATDVDLYKNPAHHTNPYHNLYTDTAAYFLTWNAGTPGKRMQVLAPEPNIGSLPAEAAFENETIQSYYESYAVGNTQNGRLQSPFFDEAEGWSSTLICTLSGNNCSSTRDFTLTLPKPNTGLPPPELELLMLGRVHFNHHIEVYVGANTGALRLTNTVNFPGFQKISINPILNWSDVDASGNMVVRILAIGVNGDIERVSISYIKIKHPQLFDFSGITSQTINLFEQAGSKSYLEISNPPNNLRLFDITDLTNSSIIGTYTEGANAAAIVQGTSTQRKLYAATATITPTLKKVSFRYIEPKQYDYIIISNKKLRTGTDPVKAFASYRTSVQGGGYDTLVVNVDLLHNQFNYGETSSRSVYQFLKFLAQHGKPKYLFIIGKGLEIDFAYYRFRTPQPTDFQDLVPVAGHPGSDLAYTAGLFGDTYEAGIATGRLTASTPTEVADYLDKVLVTEGQPFDALWRKNMLHVSGGFQVGEPARFRGYVEGFESIANDPFYGAEVEIKSKKTLSAQEQIDITEPLNAGLSMVTFFGHSSTGALDFDLASLANPDVGYANEGRYPLLLVNGCNVGAIYENAKVFAETWVLTGKKGASSFISHSSFGLENMLRTYTQYFYQHAFGDSARLQRGIGEVQVQVANQILGLGQPTPYFLSIMYQMVLMGDPALRIFGAALPDYAIQNDFVTKLSFDGKPITTATEKFGIQIKVRNYGQARKDSLRVSLTRTLGNNTVQQIDTVFKPIFYEDEFTIWVKNLPGAAGQNTFELKLDAPEKLEELNEANNTATLTFFMPSSATYNLWPYHQSLINTQAVELIFQNTNPLPITREFELEVDSLPAFNSSFLQQFSLRANVLARQSITLPAQNGTYFWRSRLKNPQPGESTDWFTSSFNYRPFNADGWGQFNHYQWQENSLSGLHFTANGQLEFDGSTSALFIQNFGSAHPTAFTSTSVKVKGDEMNMGALDVCRNNTINLLAFDKNTGLPYAPISFGNNDTRACGTEPQYILNFTQTQAQAASLGMQAAVNGMAVGDSVVLFTIGNPNVPGWNAALWTALGEIGFSSTQVAGFQAGEPLIVLGKKGVTPGLAKVVRSSLAPANQQELAITETITGRVSSGIIKTLEIGPAKAWRFFNQEFAQADAHDSKEVKIIGVTPTNQETILYQGSDIFVNLAFINPLSYPKLKLEFSVSDAQTLTPPQMRNWVVAYTPPAEGILLSRNGNQPISTFEGQPWKAKYAYINVSKYDFPFNSQGDSLNFAFDVFNPGNGKHFLKAKKIKSPAPFDSTRMEIDVNNLGLEGLNHVSLAVNTDLHLEAQFFNNSITQEGFLSVVADDQPPVLDVTVDGRYLAQGDVVSPNPNIFIQLIDAYPYRLKADTVGIVILFTNQETEQTYRVNFSATSTDWMAATSTEPFKIDFTYPLFAGHWQLSVQATDASGNGNPTPYTVTFEVVEQAGVVFGMPYPNPSKDWVYFPVKISGAQLPTDFLLEIFDPQGNKIAQFNEAQVSGLFIGSNTLRLNAKDRRPGGLPTGIYFYRMQMVLKSKSYSNTGRLVFDGQ